MFQNSAFTSALTPLNSALGRQSALLPLASPSSGFTFQWDPLAKVPVPSTDSFGPILSERAETIGKHRVFLGVDYQFFQFNEIDGVSLKKLPVVLVQPDSAGGCSINAPDGPKNTGACGFIRDVIKTDNRVDLRIHESSTFISFGITDRIDVSAVIPIENVHMTAISNATIVNNSDSLAHTFDIQPGVCGKFSPAMICATHAFSNAKNASGIGDITLRVKGTAWKGQRAAVALGGDVRFPTGDAQNFLGAGAFGLKPFVVWSYRSRISPHAFVGYESNGSSQIAGDVSIGSKARLPSQMLYSGGADVWITRTLTVAVDLVGQQVFQAQQLQPTTFTERAACLDPTCNTGLADTASTDQHLVASTRTFNITNASMGMKVKPVSALLLTGNLLFRLNSGGLRANVAPLIGVSYTF
ncbi:MAG TPA: transporter [Candidatus Angelobacter sp.]|nr:transporter [Candidatus Angelobacter sp.]